MIHAALCSSSQYLLLFDRYQKHWQFVDCLEERYTKNMYLIEGDVPASGCSTPATSRCFCMREFRIRSGLKYQSTCCNLVAFNVSKILDPTGITYFLGGKHITYRFSCHHGVVQ
jgi:hypothetical protein